MAEVVDCPRCFGEGKIDLEDHAPVAAEVLKAVRKIQPASTAMVREYLERKLSTSCVNYHLYWLEDRNYIVRKIDKGIRYFVIRNGEKEEPKGLEGWINIGDEFIWKPDVPKARENVRVIDWKFNGEELWILSFGDRLGAQWNSEDIFRESCVRKEGSQ